MKSLYILPAVILAGSALFGQSANADKRTYNNSGNIIVLPLPKPDLVVSQIKTPGGICNKMTVDVTVADLQRTGLNNHIPILLTVSQPGYRPFSRVRSIIGGIRANNGKGRTISFRNLPIQSRDGTIIINARVNPDSEIDESDRTNQTTQYRANCVPLTLPKSKNPIKRDRNSED